MMCCIENVKSYRDWSLLFLRLAIGAIFIYHGAMKFGMWSMVDAPAGMSSNIFMLMKLLAIVEPIAGVLMILGMWSQWAAIILSVIMLGALYTKMTIWNTPFSVDMQSPGIGWEFDVLLLAANAVLMTTGAGSYAVHTVCRCKKPSKGSA